MIKIDKDKVTFSEEFYKVSYMQNNVELEQKLDQEMKTKDYQKLTMQDLLDMPPKTERGKSPNDPSSPTAEPNPQSAATALSAVGCSEWLGGQKPNPSDWPRKQQSGINSSSSPTNTSPDFESECCETAAVTPTDRMVLLERNLKAELARRKEDVKKKEMSAKLVSNKDNRGGLLGQWYRLRYSLRTFVGSWRAWDDSKLEWYLARNGPPNDPSSPTPVQAGASTQLEGEKGVRCSTWLGDESPLSRTNRTGKCHLRFLLWKLKFSILSLKMHYSFLQLRYFRLLFFNRLLRFKQFAMQVCHNL